MVAAVVPKEGVEAPPKREGVGAVAAAEAGADPSALPLKMEGAAAEAAGAPAKTSAQSQHGAQMSY